MLDQNADEALNAAEHHAMDHDWAVLLAVRARIFELEALRQLKIELDRAALPSSA